MSLKLTDEDVQDLIDLAKELIEKNQLELPLDNSKSFKRIKGSIKIKHYSSTEYEFSLDYFLRPNKTILNFRELKYNYCLLRLNLNENFHKNSNGQRIHGNRINFYSVNEYSNKADQKTYMKCYQLPYKQFKNTTDIDTQLTTLLNYTNTDFRDKLDIISVLT